MSIWDVQYAKDIFMIDMQCLCINASIGTRNQIITPGQQIEDYCAMNTLEKNKKLKIQQALPI